MSDRHPSITPEISTWIRDQRMFFVATAPSALDGHINVSPKGGDSFRVLGPLEVVYQDFTGSGAETAAHARENGRIAVMFCAFEGPPKIVRIHGHATLIEVDTPGYAEFVKLFPANPGTRAFIHIRVDRVSDSCGYSVPLYQFQSQRKTLERWALKKTPEGLKAYRAAKNRQSIDGLPALSPET
jgi:Pyridoxamine 5'-phosphate oxidase